MSRGSIELLPCPMSGLTEARKEELNFHVKIRRPIHDRAGRDDGREEGEQEGVRSHAPHSGMIGAGCPQMRKG